jgi:membrane protein involved in colicin uptake
MQMDIVSFIVDRPPARSPKNKRLDLCFAFSLSLHLFLIFTLISTSVTPKTQGNNVINKPITGYISTSVVTPTKRVANKSVDVIVTNKNEVNKNSNKGKSMPEKPLPKADVFSKKMAALDILLQKKMMEQKVDSIPSKRIDKEWLFDGMDVASTLPDDILAPIRKTVEPHYKVTKTVYVDPLIEYQRGIALALQNAMRVTPTMRDKQCVIKISLSKDGLMISSEVVDGNESLCREAKNATLRVRKIDMPDDASLYQHLSKLFITISP